MAWNPIVAAEQRWLRQCTIAEQHLLKPLHSAPEELSLIDEYKRLRLACVLQADHAARANLAADLLRLEAEAFDPSHYKAELKRLRTKHAPCLLNPGLGSAFRAWKEVERILGCTVSPHHYALLVEAYFHTRDPAGLRWLLDAYDAVAASSKVAEANVAINRILSNTTYTPIPDHNSGGDPIGDGFGHGWLMHYWGEIKLQCYTCHMLPQALSVEQYRPNQHLQHLARYGLGPLHDGHAFCSNTCKAVYVALEVEQLRQQQA